MAAHSSIVESLFLKERYGEIKDIDISLFDVAADWMTVPFIHSQYQKKTPMRVGLKHPSIASVLDRPVFLSCLPTRQVNQLVRE